MKLPALLTAAALIGGCTASEVGVAYEDAVAESMADEAKAEYEKSQDFDSIAAESIEGVDTSALSALEG